MESDEPKEMNGGLKHDKTKPDTEMALLPEADETVKREAKSCTLPNIGKTIQDVPPPKPKRTYKYTSTSRDVNTEDLKDDHGYINLEEFDASKASKVNDALL